MVGQKDLYAQIVTKLRTDTGAGSLVTLTGDAANNRRIIRHYPDLKAKQSRLLVNIPESEPLNSNVTLIQKALVEFQAVANDDVLVLQILDRLETLFDFTDNVSFYDFSGGNIVVKAFTYKLRTDPLFNTSDDIWRAELQTEMIWSKISCPS